MEKQKYFDVKTGGMWALVLRLRSASASFFKSKEIVWWRVGLFGMVVYLLLEISR